jgi:hypothetical protein
MRYAKKAGSMQIQRLPNGQPASDLHTPAPQRFEKQASDMSYSATKQVRFTELQVNDNSSDNARGKTYKPPSILNNSSKKKSSHSPVIRKRTTYERAGKMAMKSNRSALSSLSSYTAKSANNRSAKKAPKSSKSPNSIKRQQEEEYDRLSAKKAKKSSRRAADGDKRVTRVTLSAKKRKGASSGRPLVNLVSKGRTQTILIDAEGLSQQQIRQIDRVTKIINNEASPKRRAYKRVALSRQHQSDRASDHSQGRVSKKSDVSKSARKVRTSNLASHRSTEAGKARTKKSSQAAANRSSHSRSVGRSKKRESEERVAKK